MMQIKWRNTGLIGAASDLSFSSEKADLSNSESPDIAPMIRCFPVMAVAINTQPSERSKVCRLEAGAAPAGTAPNR
jgi:hypothetical protein